MIIYSIDQLSERLQGANLTQVSRDCGLHLNTLRSIRDKSKDTKFSTLCTLTFYYNKLDREQEQA